MKPPPRGLHAIVLVMVTAQLHQGVGLNHKRLSSIQIILLTH